MPRWCSTFVMAEVSVVFPWSMCPMVPTLMCGLSLLNFSFAIVDASLNMCCDQPQRIDNPVHLPTEHTI
jgi:hypothetical protein